MLESPPMTEERHRVFAEGLSKGERILVVLRDELYDGSWDELLGDLSSRQDEQPVIFKLNSRIDDDLCRISKLRAYEEEHGINLRSFFEPERSEGGPL